MASNRDMMYCEKTPGRRLRPAVKESCDRSLSPCHLRAMILTALLMLFSMGVGAKVTVETGKFTGGTVVEKTQTENAADGTVTVTLTVTPAKGYAISKKDITVVATIAPSSSRGSSRRNAPEIGSPLELKGDDPKDLSQPRDYTVTLDANLGVWVKEAKFKESGAKAGNPTPITSLSSLTSDGDYIITEDIDATGYSTLATFNGTLTAQAKADGTFPVISNLSVPLFTTATDATISNIILKSVSISQTGKIGSIACTANGTTRIYNCGILSGSVGSTGTSSSKDSKDCCGGLVGELSGTARVINCYSYATITGGNRVGGIVGYNNGTTTAGSINTMVMNCMFYGDITKGITVSPIYGGNNFSNVKHDTDRNKDGLNTFNYYAYDKLKTKSIDYYNCALAVEEKYLNRFEFYRLLLNSNKKLAAIYASKEGTTVNPNDMAKWVLETADRSISGRDPYPYPILKAQRYYPSIINYDVNHAPDSASVGRNKGGKLGIKTLSVTIKAPNGWTNAPSGAKLFDESGDEMDDNTKSRTITLTRTDKDEDRFNFNYDKVQLPYYNDYGTKNYTGYKVVTGWKITKIIGGTAGTYTAADEFGGYNFADRNCTNKDLYDVSGRVFSQGAYYDVPYGVTAITIEPYWGNAAYIADVNYDVVYKKDFTGKQNVSQTGTQVGNSTTFNGQSVKSTVANALTIISNNGGLGSNVYDNAIVLTGNLHLDGVPSYGTTPFTIMSVDEDNDHEPDYSLIYHHKARLKVSPIRFDFLNVPGTSQAQRTYGASLACNVSIFKTMGWFEITNTALLYFSQFEYENTGNSDNNDNKDKASEPLILQGGVFDQFVSTQNATVSGKVIYIHVGGNVWFHEFGLGTHSDGKQSTPHVPVSVTGGDYDGFYLTGTYNQDALERSDNAECYISGGHFKEAAGASQEPINGNVRWQIYDADIDNFYGGGVNAARPIKGDVTVNIYNSHVNTYCGGPKFGNMQSGKNVKTTAEGCVFDNYFGAGYGGNSYSRKKYFDMEKYDFSSWQEKYYKADGSGDQGKYFDGETNELKSSDSKTSYGFKGIGVATDFDYEFFIWSKGNTGGRFFVKFVSFSLAQCNDVQSDLKKCIINENFYGGGSLGKVSGTATSTLEDCEVTGNVFGAGYSATLPKIKVRSLGFSTLPKFNSNSGMFEPGVPAMPTSTDTTSTTEYEWIHKDTYPNNNSGGFLDGEGNYDASGKYIVTTVDISHDNLGSVGNAILTIKGNTTVGGSVYGGGEESVVNGTTTVKVTGGTIGAEGNGGVQYGNVYGGGKGKDDDVLAGLVKGNTKVEISNGRIYHNVYGGGAYGSVGDFEYNTSGMPTGLKANTTGGKTEVYITGGTIGWNGKENGMVFGSSRGDVGTPEAIEDKMAWVHNTHVIIGKAGTPASGTEGEEGYVPATAASGPDIMGSVYGSGENGHVFENTVVDVHGGTVGISSGVKVTDDSGKEYEGAAYPYRGNVYGGGCGTDMYDSDGDNTLDSYNPLAGIVQGNTTVTIDGGHVVRNVYGAGAMGSVGIATTSGEVTTISGGQTTINISGGTIGVDGKNGDGNVFGAARGSTEAISNKYALARKGTNVSVTGGTIEGNVYGGGELGCVGTYDISDDIRTFTWQDVDGNPNTAANSDSKNTGGCKVTVNGGSAVIKGHVFGAGKGKDDTFWCEKGIAYSTDVSVTNGTVNGNVYGGGEVGRVETDTQVKIGDGDGTAEGAIAPTITGSVFGGGAGVETHGYSALVRGNTTVNVEGNAKVGHSVYGGGEIASVGKYALDGNKMPSILQGGGYCYVTVQGYATIGADVFGAGEGVKSHFDKDNADLSKRSRRMTLKDNWQSLAGDDRFAWDYLQNESDYSTYLETLALATHPEVTINGNASIGGSVFGGGELGLTKGSVIVNIKGGTIAEDVYGGGSLANTNTTSSVDSDGDGEADLTVHPTTTVKLTGGTVEGNAYGGGLGQLGTNPIEAKVYGDVLVTLNETETAGEGGTTVYNDNCVVKGSIFGCNNLNGSPQGKVTVHIYKTQGWTDDKGTPDDTSDDVSHQGTSEANLHKSDAAHSYHLAAVYGGGNMAAYVPKELSTGTTDVIIDGCGLTSIQTVYGGGNAASTPATNVTINGTYEIDEVFGGGNGKDDIVINGETKPNPGANVGFRDYSAVESEYDTKEKRLEDDFVNSYVYGTGKASVNIFGGTIHRVFGGSNTKGNVRQTAVTMLEEAGGCDFCVDEAYGGGKSAPMDAEAKLLMACIPGLSAAYGGAEAADIMGNVTLNITNGTFERVFGGNNLSGTISGAITVNIEEVGCKPIIIGELYGGGNQAAYSVFGYKKYGTSTVVRTSKDDEDAIFTPSTPYSDDQFFADPQVNVKSFTSIGTVYGGGYGADAVMVGNPTVNVSVVEGAWKDYAGDISHYTESGYVYDATGYKGETLTIEDNNGSHSVSVPSHAVGKIGAINNVFGGGNAAEVKGNTNVNIGTLAKVSIKEYVEKTVTAGGSVEGLYTRTGAGTVASPYRYTAATGTAEEGTTYYEEKAVEKDVIGADIRGNVYGGGNNAAVTGDTNVNIGKKATE